jgi:hypothetical protein
MYKIQTVDNFLEKSNFDFLFDLISSCSFPYFLQKKLNINQEDDINDCYFTHTLFFTNTVNSEYYKFFIPLFEKIKIKSLIRAKINFYPKGEKLIIHTPHTDYDFEHKGFILSFNTCDGFTILNDNTKIESISNRALFFDPSKSHSSTNCTNSIGRFNININYF